MRSRSERRINSFRCPARVAGNVPFEAHSRTVAGIDAQLLGDLGHRQPGIVLDILSLVVRHVS
jgi:hypothetical protein